MYCTGYEAVFCNLFAVALGPIMLNIPSPYLYIWFGLVSLNSTFTHSGFRLGWLMDGSHDIHHETFKYNYGTLTIFDRIYGTYYDPTPSDDSSEDIIEMEPIKDIIETKPIKDIIDTKPIKDIIDTKPIKDIIDTKPIKE